MRYRIQAVLIIFGIVLTEVCFLIFIQHKIKEKQQINIREYANKIDLNEKIIMDIKCFPISKKYREQINFEDSYGSYRDNGSHEGCDIMHNDNIAGDIPIISATDGTVTNIGWLYLGGYRVGITSGNGIYYYYAHFDSCAPGLYVGKEVKAGEFLGFMGNTGEGEEGTKGMFPVHLHFGIYIEDKKGNESTVNPYPYLLKINEE